MGLPSIKNTQMLKKTKVLIAGAGPTGLMMACQLRRMGIDCIIFDKKKGPTVESRALVVHARSMEIYDQMGIADEVIQNGEVMGKVRFLLKSKKVAEATFGDIGKGLSKFPYLMVFEQNKNEKLLYEYLQKKEGNVLWKHELVDVKQDENKVSVELKDEQGIISTIEADWLVAADGAGSPVRHALNLSFKGDTYEHIFYVADTKLKWPWGHDALDIYVAKNMFMGLFPMKGEDRFRVIGVLPPGYQNEHPDSFEEIIPHIQSAVKIPLEFSDTSWFSIYRLHHRCIDQFRVNRIFLCGDAAHIHSPAGGQGMNTGLQDAYNLAWKLAYTLNGFSHENLLNSYQQERLPFAKRLMVTTDQGFTILSSSKWWPRFVRMFVFPFLVPIFLRFRFFRRLAFKTVSQTGISYLHSPLTVKRKHGHVKSGQRLPYLLFNDGSCLYDKMKKMKFHLLLFSKNENRNISAASALTEEFINILDVLEIHNGEKSMYDTLGIKEELMILVRPDHYIAAITSLKNTDTIRNYLHRLKDQ
jgi:2-polyprenyl-6-methoxyphenol hydroxylase-like FAD-dependent oxidoreductase